MDAGKDRLVPHPNIRKRRGRNFEKARRSGSSAHERKGRVPRKHPPRKRLRLENEAHAGAGTERLLEEVAGQAKYAEGLLEVGIRDSESLVAVLVEEGGPSGVSDVKGIECEFQTEPFVQLPRIFDVGIHSSDEWCTAQIAAAKQG